MQVFHLEQLTVRHVWFWRRGASDGTEATNMNTAVATPTLATPARIWGGRVLTTLPILVLALSASMKLAQAPSFLEKWTGEMGFSASTLVPIGILEVFVAAMYAIPRTRILGAILVTGYLGGAIVTHLRVGQPFAIAFAFLISA